VRALVTGADGFVGRHLVAAAPEGAELVTPSREALDLLDADATAAVVADAPPDVVIHLAAQASVPASWRDPRATLNDNLAMAVNLLEAVREHAPAAVVVVVGSGEQYGPVVPERLPVTEDEPQRPQNPYAVSKVAVDALAGFYADAHGMKTIRTRAFNHAGPGQSDLYVISAFARQIADAERAGGGELVLETGNLEPRRDFSDVRDVVRAYWELAQLGEPGVFNVCRGDSASVADILARLTAMTELEVRQHTDPSRLRKHEVMDIRGSHDRLTRATGWEPEVALDQTLADTLDWWRANG
jgi:GDP-4-dehydro-6-deoxy-D-mannose reductase